MSDSLWCHGLYSPWCSPGQNTGVGSHFLLQGIFPTQGLNPGLPHCREIPYQLSHLGSPRTLEWVAYPFSSRSSWPRNRTGIFRIAGGFFTSWAIREAPQTKVQANHLGILLNVNSNFVDWDGSSSNRFFGTPVHHLLCLLAVWIKSLFLASTTCVSICWPDIWWVIWAWTW